MSEELADKFLSIGDDVTNVEEFSENEHYLITFDPTAEENEEQSDWAVILLTKPYVDFLVRFDNIEMTGRDVFFDYQILSMPEDEVEVDEVHLANHLTSVLMSVLEVFRAADTLIEEEIEPESDEGEVVSEQ